jgi:dolichol-phosphate mannosyltransferase
VKNLIIIPTYNEKDNIRKIIKSILSISDADILIVDDNSPDKTAEIVKEITKVSKRVNLLFRQTKNGLGKAYMAGFSWAIEHNYDFVVSMDADFSHRPEDLGKLLMADSKYDVVIGSRYVPGGKIIGWNLKRQLNSRLANIITRFMLSLKNKDVTSGYKRYSRKFIKAIDFGSFYSFGYSFQVEMIYWASQNNFSIKEVPITFVDRRAGESKISGELKKSAKVIWQIFIHRRAVKQLIKFLLIGVLNTLVDWLIFYILRLPLSNYGQWGKQLAKAGSFIVSGSSSYILNRRWTFRSTDAAIFRQAGRFFAVAIFGLILNNLIFYIITAPHFFHQKDIVGIIFATALVTFWNFFVHRKWTFK